VSGAVLLAVCAAVLAIAVPLLFIWTARLERETASMERAAQEMENVAAGLIHGRRAPPTLTEVIDGMRIADAVAARDALLAAIGPLAEGPPPYFSTGPAHSTWYVLGCPYELGSVVRVNISGVRAVYELFSIEPGTDSITYGFRLLEREPA